MGGNELLPIHAHALGRNAGVLLKALTDRTDRCLSNHLQLLDRWTQKVCPVGLGGASRHCLQNRGAETPSSRPIAVGIGIGIGIGIDGGFGSIPIPMPIPTPMDCDS
jgi:hypothetical protein